MKPLTPVEIRLTNKEYKSTLNKHEPVAISVDELVRLIKVIVNGQLEDDK